MIELKESELSGRFVERLSSAAIGERLVIVRNGQPPLEIERCAPTPRGGGLNLDKWRAALKRHGIKPSPPAEVAAMKAAIADSSLSCRLLGVDEE